MRRIIKGNPPDSFMRWVRRKPKDRNENQWFEELYEGKHWDVVSALSEHNAKEQYYLCAYCCTGISGASVDTVNEHVEARGIAPRRSLDHHNIVASCKNRNQCDAAHKSQALPLTPLMDECETELKFKVSGRVEGLTDRAVEAIRVLNLGDHERSNKALIGKRKQLSDTLLFANGLYPDQPFDDELLLMEVIQDLLTPKDGKLEEFAPVVANILRHWISTV